MTVDAVITLFENIIYPAEMCGERACRAGADLLRRLTGLNLYEELCSCYVPGAEDVTVCAALSDRLVEPDPRLIRKIAAVMAVSGVQVAPYEDAREVFSFFQATDIPCGLVVDGPTHMQRLIFEHLKVDRVFSRWAHTEDFSGETPWMDAVYYLSLLLDCPLSRTALICSSEEYASAMEGRFCGVYYVERTGFSVRAPAELRSTRRVAMRNLYDLPEVLGMVGVPACRQLPRRDV